MRRRRMKKCDTEIAHYTHGREGWPSSLKTAEDVSGVLGISAERVNELAEQGFMPHYLVDGTSRWYQTAEVKRWAAKNLLYVCGGADIEKQVVVYGIRPERISNAPVEIAYLPNLCRLDGFAHPPGVYFLLDSEGSIMYIGQSVNPVSRVTQHASNGMGFSSAFFMPVLREHLDDVEAALIRSLRPPQNGRHSSKIDPTGERMAAPCGHPKGDEFVLDNIEKFTINVP